MNTALSKLFFTESHHSVSAHLQTLQSLFLISDDDNLLLFINFTDPALLVFAVEKGQKITETEKQGNTSQGEKLP